MTIGQINLNEDTEILNHFIANFLDIKFTLKLNINQLQKYKSND